MRRLLPIALLAALYLPALGSPSSGTHPDEAYYLGISAEMDARGAWLTPTIDGEAKWFKPPLLYWGQRLAYGAFGRGFFGGRLPAALATVALALLTGALARRMYGDRAALTATLLTATTFGWLKFGRIAMMDAPMALGLTAAAYGAWRGAEEDDPRQLLWAGVGAGVAFMLKGPVGAVLVLLIAGGFLAFRRPGLLASRWTAAAFALGAAIGLPWYVASFAVHGRRFYDFFVLEQNVDRFMHPWTLHGEGVLLVGWLVFLLPWTPLALAAIPPPRRWREPEALLPLVWIGAVLLVFTIPSLKWPHYGLACAPAAALLASREAPPRWARVLTAAVLAGFAAVAWAMLRWPLPRGALLALLAAGAALLGGAWLVARARVVEAALAAAAAFALALALVVPAVNPPVIPPGQLARLDGRDLYVYDFVSGLFTLAAGRPVRHVERDDLDPVIARGGVVILTAPALDRLPAPLRERVAPVARWERLRPYLPPATVLRAWRDRDPNPLFEGMVAIQAAPSRGR